MNEITVEAQDSTNPHAYEGSIWIYDEQPYIFAQVDYNKFCLVELKSGNRSHDPSDDFRTITEDAKLFCMQVRITIEKL